MGLFPQFCNQLLTELTEVALHEKVTNYTLFSVDSVASSLVSMETLKAAIDECNEGEKEESERAFAIIDAFTVPRFTYDHERKKFLK